MNINYCQCKKIVKCLDNYFQNNRPLEHVEFPSTIKYKTDSYYLYMFYSCLLDYGMRSKIYHQNLVKTYKNYPEIFNPDFVLSMNEDDLRNIIVSSIHPRYPNVALKKWIELSNVLKKYESIKDILKRMNSFQELNCFIKGIKGYGQKTGGLLIRIIVDSRICNFEEEIDSIPIDRHDIEISYFVNIIDSKTITSSDIQNLSDAYVNVGKELHINPSNIDKYLWEIGNSFCNKKDCKNCPIYSFCSRK